MEVRFLCIQGGKQFYEVILSGEQIFVGSRGECARFTKIHDDKVALEHADASRAPRSRAVPVRTYHQSRLRA